MGTTQATGEQNNYMLEEVVETTQATSEQNNYVLARGREWWGQRKLQVSKVITCK